MKLCSSSQTILVYTPPLLTEVRVDICQTIRSRILLVIGSLRQQGWHPE